MKIVVTGSVAYDYLMTFPGYFKEHIIPEKLETISLSFLVDSMVRQRGGTAPNIAYTLALLGERPYLLATAGEDFEEYRAWLELKGIDTKFVSVVPGKYTASFFANTDLSNAQIASFYSGAMADSANLSIYDMDDLRPDLFVISPNDPDAMVRFARECHELNIPYVYDPSQQLVRMNPVDIRNGVNGAFALFVNEYEYELLRKHTGLTEEELLSQVQIMVVTCGEQGARIFANGKVIPVPAVRPVQILDPTGVGDAFRGGFLTGYRLGLDWETCGRMGALAATYCLEHRGPQNHVYTPAEFVSRYVEVYGDAPVLNILLSQPIPQPKE